MNDYALKSYFYDLPRELIAQRAQVPRDHSRLLVYDERRDEVIHSHFSQLSDFLPPESDLILNRARVFACRLLGEKESGGKVEVFLLSKKADERGLFSCLMKSNGKKRLGEKIFFGEGVGEGLPQLSAKIEGVSSSGFKISIQGDLDYYLRNVAKIPIPPYIRSGESDELDRGQYQTIYASERAEDENSVAAPTAGLHFTRDTFAKLSLKGISPLYVTLHVGLGTFLPVKSENILDHRMHSESYYVDAENWRAIQNSSFPVAVGTTSLRVLESLWKRGGDYRPGTLEETDIFLYPGVQVQSIQALITNFHLPESTLLMLVASLLGREKTMELYALAVKEKYRFFSYGDAMLILRDPFKDKREKVRE